MIKNSIIIIIALVVAVVGYFLFMNQDVSAPSTDQKSGVEYYSDGKQIVYCDEAGNSYDTVAGAKAAGLTETQYDATYCPEYVSTVTGDYAGMSTADAEAKAQAAGVMFRVVIADGQPQPITQDFRKGRISATVEKGFVTKYSVETNKTADGENAGPVSGTSDAIIGMTTAEAETYAKAKGVDFRTGTIDGVAMAVTLDFRPGRITAETKNDVVIGYTVE